MWPSASWTKTASSMPSNRARAQPSRACWRAPASARPCAGVTGRSSLAGRRSGEPGCSPLQVVIPDLAVQGRALDLEDGGRLALVPFRVLQGLQDVQLLHLLEG